MPCSLQESVYTLKVFPNPAHDNFNISAMDNQSGRLVIYNYTGQIVYDTPFYKEKTIATTGFETGLYFIELTNSLTTHKRRITIRLENSNQGHANQVLLGIK
jgi:hypothetical protein